MVQGMEGMQDTTQGQGSAAPEASVQESPGPRQIPIGGHFNKTPSSYWSLALPALSVRYLAETISDWLQPGKSFFSVSKGLADRMHAVIAGSFLMTVSGFYLRQTYQDMRNLFAEPLAWELGKKPDDIGILDIIKSKNSLVEAARRNFFKYNARRIGVNSIFFTSMLPFVPNKFKPNDDHAVKLGTFGNGLYLMNDVLQRKETFFEALQTFVATKINHADRVGELITANDLMNLYDRHGRDMDKAYSLPKMNTPDWQNDLLLFGRMADLMNQTYGNAPNTDHADFTVPKLIYLLGNGLVKSESLEKNLAYVELANRSKDMKKVSEMAEAFKGCTDLKQVMDKFAITLPAVDTDKIEEERRQQWKKWLTPEALKTLEESDARKAEEAKGFAGKVAGENRSNGRDVTPPSGNHADKALHKAEAVMGVS